MRKAAILIGFRVKYKQSDWYQELQSIHTDVFFSELRSVPKKEHSEAARNGPSNQTEIASPCWRPGIATVFLQTSAQVDYYQLGSIELGLVHYEWWQWDCIRYESISDLLTGIQCCVSWLSDSLLRVGRQFRYFHQFAVKIKHIKSSLEHIASGSGKNSFNRQSRNK
jgi:hypothetical protein